MNEKLSGNTRKWCALIISVFLYYFIHEGSHLIIALWYGVFQEIRFLGPGVQVAINTEPLTENQLVIFSISGGISTLIAAWIFTGLTPFFTKMKKKFFRAAGYYTTIAMMFIDPIYLSFLYRFFGGGDMNGILLSGVPEMAVQIIFGVIGIIHILIFWKWVHPLYKKSFIKKERFDNNPAAR